MNPINAEIELFGHHRSIKLPIYGAKVFAVRNGTIDIHGCPIGKTWTVINQTAEAGDNQIVLQDSVFNSSSPMTSWKPGDTIVVATTGGRLTMAQNEVHTIADISPDGFTVTLTEPLEYRHLFHISQWDGQELKVTAEVGLLTRNVKFHGNVNEHWAQELPLCDEVFNPLEGAVQNCFLNKFNDEIGSDEFGAHMILHYIKRARISHIEVTQAGQGSQLGRYPLHFHNSGNQPDSYISHNGIHTTFNRAVTMHGVWNATVEWNVAYNCKGHNYFIEDAVEEDLLIQYNLAVHTKPSNSLLNSDQRATSFWITNAYNTIQHNHAVGGAQTGFWVNPPSVSGHANADCPPIVRSHCPMYTGTKRWFNNTAHDMGFYGLWIFMLELKGFYRPSTVDCEPTWPPGQAIFEKGTFWNNLRGAEMAHVGDNIWFKDMISANNGEGGLSILETSSLRYEGEYGQYATGISNSITIGYVDDTVPELSSCTRFGVETPWKKSGHLVTEGIKFYNFDKNGSHSGLGFQFDPTGCTAIDACYNSYEFDCGRTSHWEQVEWHNSPRKFAADWEHETVLLDRDGSLTETGVPGFSIVPYTELYPASMCTAAPDFSVEFPALLCNSIEYNRIGINRILPSTIRGFSMIVQNRWGQSVIPFRRSRSTHGMGWMGILLSGEHHDIWWVQHEHISNITYSAAIYDLGADKHVSIRHPFGHRTDYAGIAGQKMTMYDQDLTLEQFPLDSVNDYTEYMVGQQQSDASFSANSQPFDYFIDDIDHSLTYVAARDTAINRFYDLRYQFSVYKCFWPGCIPPTTPPPTTPPIIATVCNWSDSNCWSDGQVPTSGSDVVIPNDREVIIDQNIDVRNLYVEGTLTVSNASDITITAENILINTGWGHSGLVRSSITVENGNFFAGTEGEPWSCQNTLTINLRGNTTVDEFGAPFGTVPLGGKSIGIMGGFKLYGCPQATPWALLQHTIFQGDNEITLDRDISNWRIGGEISIAPTNYDAREAEKNIIVNIVGRVVTLENPINFTHTGVVETDYSFGNMAAEVQYLSRNVKVHGTEESLDFFGGRVVAVKSDDGSSYRRGWAQIDSVEFRHMGQFGYTRTTDSRAALAFYHLGIQDPVDDKRSFVTNSAFHESYNSAIIVGHGTDNLLVDSNVIFRTVTNAVRVFGDDAIISNNVITFVEYELLYQGFYTSETQLNQQPPNTDLPAGVDTLGTFSVTLINNRVSGVDGPAYKGHGQRCTSRELCEVGGQSGPLVNSTNMAHSCLRGYSIVKKASRDCVRYEGFYFWRISDYGIYTQAFGAEIHIKNNVIVDAVVGICNIIVGNGNPVKHEHGDMMISIDNNLFVARSDHHSCSDYQNRDHSLIVTSEMTVMNRAPWSERGSIASHTGIFLPFFAHKGTKFPKKPMHTPREAAYNSPNGRSCMNNNIFENFNNDACNPNNPRRPRALMTNPGVIDHTHMIEMSNTAFINSQRRNWLHFRRPLLSDVTLSNCVDMSCDGPKKVFIKDLDGTFSGTGEETSIFAQSEYHWEGVSGYDWSPFVDPSFGLGDYRIPESMLTNPDGSIIDINQYAPNKGHSQSDSCNWNNNWRAFQCTGSQRGHLYFESLDFDMEVRRVAPIGLRSSSGFIDLVNGPHDNTCCAGYSCSLRATYNYFLTECGETYDFHTTGTMPTKVQFSLHNMPPTCKVRIQMYTMRPNRQDVFLNGDNIIYSNQYNFGNDTWMFPSKDFIPEVTDSSGSNYYDRPEQMLYFVIGGGDQLQVRIASSIILSLDIVTELTPEEFYASENLPYLLAALLNLDPSQVKIVEVVREVAGAAQKRWRRNTTLVSKPELQRNPSLNVQIELSNEPDFDHTYSSGNFGPSTRRGQYDSFDEKRVGNSLVAMQLEGTLDGLIEQNSGQSAEVMASSLTSSAIEGETPRWYEPGTDGEDQTIYRKLNIDPDSVPDENVTQIIEETALAMNATDLLNHTTVEQQMEMESTISKTTEAISYSAKPTTMVVVQQVPQKIFVGSYMDSPIKVAMLDEDGYSMTEVGYNGDPMRVTLMANTPLENAEVKFTPGSGIASFDKLLFLEPGRFSFIVALSYTGLANVTVDPIHTISFEVTDDVPDRIEVGTQPEQLNEQLLPLAPVEIIIFDTNNNQMDGNIITASDPWRVCVGLVNENGLQIDASLFGVLEVPFMDGVVTFDELMIRERHYQVRLRFDLCYAGNADVASLAFDSIFSNPFDVINVNECFEGIDQCSENANCTDSDGSYNCDCNDGFVGNGFVCMREENECALGTDDCDVNAVCSDAPLGFTCSCLSGFTGNGKTCSDIDECAADSDWCNENNSDCVNEIGDFSCHCKDGYQSGEDNKICVDIDECQDNVCEGENQQCHNVPGNYFCVCGQGFELVGNNCEDIDECSTNQHVCGENTECLNSVGGYECLGTGGGGGEEKCEDVTCPSGHECKAGECVDIDECSTGNHHCQSFEECRNIDRGFTCEFDYSANCPNSKYPVEWKGAKYTKVLFQSETSMVALVNVNRMGGYNFRKNQYIGFISYPRKDDL